MPVGDLSDHSVDTDSETGQVVSRAGCRGNAEAELAKPAGDDDSSGLVAVGQGQEHGAGGRQHRACSQLGLVEREAERGIDAHHLARRPHLRAEGGVDLWEPVERKDRLFDRDVPVR